eukprot:TRINITY_DN69498_c0_g1_i1.p1 TRINITY_DN69498_c0_g1~~TRINITY_DN69498_c0_g1_i1.p1  ORF type:complete len:193 (+),score=28.54 TRINITY_DN69498_c0_g1_i1:65-643(+)
MNARSTRQIKNNWEDISDDEELLPLDTPSDALPARGSTEEAINVVELMCADGIKISVDKQTLYSYYGEQFFDSCSTSNSTRCRFESWVIEAFIHIALNESLPKGFLKRDTDRRHQIFLEAAKIVRCKKAQSLVIVLKTREDELTCSRKAKQKQQKEQLHNLRGGNRVSAKGIAARNRADTYERYEKALSKYL